MHTMQQRASVAQGVARSAPSRSAVKVVASTQRPRSNVADQAALVAGSALVVLQVHPAVADEAVVAAPAVAAPVDTAVDSVIEAVKATGGFIKTGLDFLGAGAKVLKEGIDVATPVVKEGLDVVTPSLQQAYKVTSEAAGPVLKQATPVVQSGLDSALKASGVDFKAVSDTTATVSKTAQAGAEQAAPYVSKAVTFLTTTDPVLLGEYAAGALALYLVAPPLLGAVFGSLRGFAGELSAATALDLINRDGNTTLVDIRTEKEKEAAGLLDIPSGAPGKIVEVEYAVTEDKRLRGQLRDPAAIEAQVTALQIAALKRLSRGTRILLLDRTGGASKVVAKELAKKGFGSVFVVSGGFDGGWVKSKLQIKPTVSFYSAAPKFGTVRSPVGAVSGRRALPSPK